MIAAAQRSGCELFLRQLPDHAGQRHPARAVAHKNFGVRTFQAEDEIAAVGLGHRRGLRRRHGRDRHQRPGHCAQGRGDRPGGDDRAAAGDRQRAARRSEHRLADQDRAGRPAAGACSAATASARCRCSPPRSPADCFDVAIEAWRIAVAFMTPVIAAHRRLPRQRLRAVADSRRRTTAADRGQVSRTDRRTAMLFHALRPRRAAGAALGHPRHAGAGHRIGGLEKQDITGNVSYDRQPRAHVELRARKVAGIADDIPPQEVDGPRSGELLVVGWGGTYGALRHGGRRRLRRRGGAVAHCPPALPQPVARRTWARSCAVQEGAGARAEPGPAAA